MPAVNALSLQMVRLRAAEEWTKEGKEFYLLLPKGGSGKFMSGSLVRPLMPGDVLVVTPSLEGRVSVFNESEFLFSYFYLHFENLHPLLSCTEIAAFQSVMDRMNGIRLYPATSGLAMECHRCLLTTPVHFDLNHRCHLLRLAAIVLAVEFGKKTEQAGPLRVEDRMVQVFAGLSVAEILTSSVEDLAAKFGCCRRHLNRLFHEHVGLSVAALKMEMRLLRAVSLLRDPNAKVINVAEECGFNHLGLFNTCFKRRFGLSPGQWRKKLAQTETQLTVLFAEDQSCPMRDNDLCPWGRNSRNGNVAGLKCAAPTAKAAPGGLLRFDAALQAPAKPTMPNGGKGFLAPPRFPVADAR